MRHAFVKDTLERLMKEAILRPDDSVLAVCAGVPERLLFEELGFTAVTISNLDERLTGCEFAPYAWSFQDAQKLTFGDGAFDWVFVSDGLHHCSSPHLALLEMYRVARKGILVFESRDSFVMRVANRFNLVPQYELEAVVANGFTHGGVDNTQIPNYIYRWTEREFRKTLLSYNPTGAHDFRFFYGLNLPYGTAEMKKGSLKRNVVRYGGPFLRLAAKLFRTQCNSFAMVALKPRGPGDLWPWLEREEDRFVFNRDYAKDRFKIPT
jgi:ubiquinone/menaquinone biosynthesis C-methylase UbiE